MRSPGDITLACKAIRSEPCAGGTARLHSTQLMFSTVTVTFSDESGSLIALSVIGLLSYCVVLRQSKTILSCSFVVWGAMRPHADLLLHNSLSRQAIGS